MERMKILETSKSWVQHQQISFIRCFLIYFFLCWCIVDLQYVLVSGVRQSDSVIPISLLFQILFLSRLLQNVEFPVLHSRPLLSIYFMYSSAYMLIPVSQFIPPPHLSALVTLNLFSFFFFLIFLALPRTQSRVCVLVVSSFHLLSVKTTGMCVRPLSVSFKELGVWWFC